MVTTTIRPKPFYTLLIMILLGVAGAAWAQAPEAAQREPLRVIDMPTAGLNHRSEFNSDLRIYPEGGIQMQMGVGLFRRFMMGLSYGGTNVVGRGKVEGNKQPGVLVKYRLWEETEGFPAIVGGYDNQGAGRWSDTLNRFEYKSPGLFIVASKNFGIGESKNLGLHAMVNWNSTETEDDRGMSGSIGCDVSLNEELVLLMEYNAAQDDFKKKNGNYLSLGRGRGYLNGGVRWAIGKIYLQFEFKDMMGNRVNNPGGPDRAFTISYAENIKW